MSNARPINAKKLPSTILCCFVSVTVNFFRCVRFFEVADFFFLAINVVCVVQKYNVTNYIKILEEIKLPT